MHGLFFLLLYLNMSLKVALTVAVIQLMKVITTAAVTCVFVLNNSHNSHATNFNVMEECILERPPPSVCVMLCHVVPCHFRGAGVSCALGPCCVVSEILLCLFSRGCFAMLNRGCAPLYVEYTMLRRIMWVCCGCSVRFTLRCFIASRDNFFFCLMRLHWHI